MEQETEIKTEISKETTDKFKENIVERNTIDMKLYNVPKQYAIKFKKFADANGMKFNSAMILLLEKLDTYEKYEELEQVIFKNAEAIDRLFTMVEEMKNPQPVEPEQKVKRVGYGSKVDN